MVKVETYSTFELHFQYSSDQFFFIPILTVDKDSGSLLSIVQETYPAKLITEANVLLKQLPSEGALFSSTVKAVGINMTCSVCTCK